MDGTALHDAMLRDFMAKHNLAPFQADYLQHVCSDLKDLDEEEVQWMNHILGPNWRIDSAAIEEADSDGSGDTQ